MKICLGGRYSENECGSSGRKVGRKMSAAGIMQKDNNDAPTNGKQGFGLKIQGTTMSTFRVCAVSLAASMAVSGVSAYAGVCDNEISGQIVSKVMHETMTGYVIKSDKLNDLVELRTTGDDSTRLSKGFVTKASIEGAKCSVEKNADGVEIYVLVKGSGKVKKPAAGALSEKEMQALYDSAMELNGNNSEMAFSKMKKAADAGMVLAQYRLGAWYLLGNGVASDPQMALKYYEMAADKGDSNAINELAIMYDEAKGIPADHEKATELFRKCAKLDNEYCMNNLALRLGNSPEEQKEAAELFKKTAERGNAVGLANYGAAMCSGDGVDQPDGGECIRLLTEAMNKGYAWAYSRLAQAYKDGEAGMPVDPKKAFEIMKSGLSTGDANVINNYGYYLDQGIGCDVDYKTASRYFLLAAEKGLPIAMANVGEYYEKGQGYFQKDLKKATEWYKKASSAGYDASEALKRIGSE